MELRPVVLCTELRRPSMRMSELRALLGVSVEVRGRLPLKPPRLLRELLRLLREPLRLLREPTSDRREPMRLKRVDPVRGGVGGAGGAGAGTDDAACCCDAIAEASRRSANRKYEDASS